MTVRFSSRAGSLDGADFNFDAFYMFVAADDADTRVRFQGRNTDNGRVPGEASADQASGGEPQFFSDRKSSAALIADGAGVAGGGQRVRPLGADAGPRFAAAAGRPSAVAPAPAQMRLPPRGRRPAAAQDRHPHR